LHGIVHTKAHKALIATISAYLTENKIPQKEWAQRCKRDEKWASAVLNGHRGVQAGELPRIAKALDTTPLKFFKRFLAILGT
jgi:transcriptional regulator with XRE-family HTH domain